MSLININNDLSKTILYKAISSSNGDWICGYIIETKDGISISGIGYKQNIEFENVLPDTICQITPLKTINNEAIFEYDIVLYDNDEYYVLCCNFPCWYYLHLIVEEDNKIRIDADSSNHMVPNPYIASKVKKVIGNFKDISYPSNRSYRKFKFDSKSYIN